MAGTRRIKRSPEALQIMNIEDHTDHTLRLKLESVITRTVIKVIYQYQIDPY